MKNNILKRAISFISIYAFWDSSSTQIFISNPANLFTHSCQKICKQYLLSSWKTDLTATVILHNFTIFYRGKSSSKLNLIFIYFSSQSSWIIICWSKKNFDLCPHFLYFFSMSLFISLKTSVKCSHDNHVIETIVRTIFDFFAQFISILRWQ